MTTKTATLSRLSITLAAASLAVSVLPLSAQAATSQSFQISPPTANYAADPGHQTEGTIKVTNLTDNPISLKVGKQNFVAKGEEGEIELTDSADPLYSLAPWFNLIEPTVEVAPRATQSVHYLVQVPTGAEPGGRYGSIVFSSTPPKLPSGVSGATVQQNLAAIVFERINGAANENLSVLSFKAAQSFYEYGPVQIDTRLKNSGNVHEKATGTITIKNMLGITVAKIPLDEHFVIPNAVRHLKNIWPDPGKHPFLFGSYTAQLSATYSGKSLTATTSFLVLPWRVMLLILIALIIIFIIFWRGRKRLARAGRILAGRE
jgi:hypothetical protein